MATLNEVPRLPEGEGPQGGVAMTAALQCLILSAVLIRAVARAGGDRARWTP